MEGIESVSLDGIQKAGLSHPQRGGDRHDVGHDDLREAGVVEEEAQHRLHRLIVSECEHRREHQTVVAIGEALRADYLLEGGVFTQDLIDTWIETKRKEADYVQLRPHPAEFELYYDL